MSRCMTWYFVTSYIKGMTSSNVVFFAPTRYSEKVNKNAYAVLVVYVFSKNIEVLIENKTSSIAFISEKIYDTENIEYVRK